MGEKDFAGWWSGPVAFFCSCTLHPAPCNFGHERHSCKDVNSTSQAFTMAGKGLPLLTIGVHDETPFYRREDRCWGDSIASCFASILCPFPCRRGPLCDVVLVLAAELAALLPVLQVTEQTALPMPPHNLRALIPMVAAS